MSENEGDNDLHERPATSKLWGSLVPPVTPGRRYKYAGSDLPLSVVSPAHDRRDLSPSRVSSSGRRRQQPLHREALLMSPRVLSDDVQADNGEVNDIGVTSIQ